MNNDRENYQKVVSELIEIVTELQSIEQRKLEAATKNRISLLQTCMNEEQALALKFRGIEKKRLDLQEKLGFGEKSFKEILKCIPDEEKGELPDLYEQLSEALRQFNITNKSAQSMIEVNLHKIEKALEHADAKTLSSIRGGSAPSGMTNRLV